jgi:hypothetical protein
MSAELALQRAIVARLRADDALEAITGPLAAPGVGARVYDNVASGTATPYVSIRSIQTLDDGADCVDGQEIFIDLDAWSIKPGKVEASQMVGAVRTALHEAVFPLDNPFRLVEIAHRDTQVDAPSDGITTRARMTFRALVERV